MQDPRLQELANTLIDHSCRLSAGDKVLIEAFDLPDPCARLPAGGNCLRAWCRPAGAVEE